MELRRASKIIGIQSHLNKAWKLAAAETAGCKMHFKLLHRISQISHLNRSTVFTYVNYEKPLKFMDIQIQYEILLGK